MKRYKTIFKEDKLEKEIYSKLKKIINYPEEKWQDYRIMNSVEDLKNNFSKYLKLFKLMVNEALSKNYFDLGISEAIKLEDNLVKKYLKIKDDLDRTYFRLWLRDIIYKTE